MLKLKGLNVSVLTLRSHSSHLSQPLDRCVNSNFKRKIAKLYSKKINNMTDHRKEVVKIIQNCVHYCMSPAIITEAFSNAGIIPFCPEKVLDGIPFGDLNTIQFFNKKKQNTKTMDLECALLTSDEFLSRWN
jgi:hypothetical protein